MGRKIMLLLSACFWCGSSIHAGIYDTRQAFGIYAGQPYGLYYGGEQPVEFSIESGRTNPDLFTERQVLSQLPTGELSNRLKGFQELAYTNGDRDAARQYILLSDEAKRRAMNYQNLILSTAKEVENSESASGFFENIIRARKSLVIVLLVDFSFPEKAGLSAKYEEVILELLNRGWSYHLVFLNNPDRYRMDDDCLKGARNRTLDEGGILAKAFGIKTHPAIAVYNPVNNEYTVICENKYRGADFVESMAAEFYRNVRKDVQYPVLKMK